MKNKIKDSYNSLQISEELEKNILNKTINKKKKFKYKKVGYVIGMFLLIFTISISLANAKQIVEFFKNWDTGVEFEDGTKVTLIENANFKEININAKKSEEPIDMTHDEVERNLGFHILDYDNTSTKTIGYSTDLNEDGSIAVARLWWANFITNNDENWNNIKAVSVSITILNKYAEEKYVLPFFEGLDATSEKELDQVYEIKSLDTKAVIYGNSWDKRRLTAAFVYDNVVYEFIGRNYTKDEIIEILENLK